MKYALIALILAASAAQAQQLQPQLINWFASADIVGSGDIRDSQDGSGDDIPDGMGVREFEFSANSQIDQTWEGQLTLAYHKELYDDESETDVHEAFIFSPKVFDRATVKLGKFFLGFGRLNRFHRHDWIFTEAPIYHKSFFGNEGVSDTGAEYTALGNSDSLWKVTLGLVSGKEFVHSHAHSEDGEDEEGEEEGEESGHSHSEGQPYTPTGYMRISTFNEITPSEGYETGINFITRNDAEGTRFHYAGLDFIYKERVAQYVNHLFQAEAWSRTSYAKGENDGVEDLGAYFYYEKGLDRHHSLGFRYDFFKPGEANEHEEEEEEDHEHEGHREIAGLHVLGNYNSYTAVYTYRNSEFMRTRFSIEHTTGIEIAEEESSVTKGLLQIVFMIGAHPAHLY